MRAYPEGHTGDSLMALWFAISEIRDRTSKGITIPGEFIEKENKIDLKNPIIFKEQERKADDALRMEQEYERSNFNRIMGNVLRR